MKKQYLGSMAVCLVAMLLISGVQAADVPNYTTVTFLPSIGGTINGRAMGINDAGQVVGETSPSIGKTRATLWNGLAATELVSLGGTFSTATSINDSGQVVGRGGKANDNNPHAILWDGATATELGTLGNSYSVAADINNAGQVVGIENKANDIYAHATLWNGTAATELGASVSSAYAINNAGQVVGSRSIGRSYFGATLWDGTTVYDLDNLGGTDSLALDINNASEIVGHSETANGRQHATRWNGTTATDLGTLSGTSDSTAYAINDTGLVVGYSFNPEDGYWDGYTYIPNNSLRATLWNGTTAIDLNTYLDATLKNAGWYLAVANDINTAGTVVGLAININGQRSAPFVLSVIPIPEPQTYAMMFLGLGMVACFVLCRSRQQQ